MNTVKPNKTRGRPRAFDHEEALGKALNVFWTRGYEGASMAELTDALGINRPSLYAAFGNKEELFRKALAKYLAGPVSYAEATMHEPTARKAVEKFLRKSAELLTNPNNPRGCMIVQGALSCGQGSELIQRELITYRKNYEDRLKQRFELAQKQGDLPGDSNAADLAKYIATIHQGMSVQATSGASYEELIAVVNTVLDNLPENQNR
ncbi:MAG TPA: TetR/AcrR family transcriptional regulator [Methylophilaceae bacterium]|jgi:AcrR family transcriptional regulator